MLLFKSPPCAPATRAPRARRPPKAVGDPRLFHGRLVRLPRRCLFVVGAFALRRARPAARSPQGHKPVGARRRRRRGPARRAGRAGRAHVGFCVCRKFGSLRVRGEPLPRPHGKAPRRTPWRLDRAGGRSSDDAAAGEPAARDGEVTPAVTAAFHGCAFNHLSAGRSKAAREGRSAVGLAAAGAAEGRRRALGACSRSGRLSGRFSSEPRVFRLSLKCKRIHPRRSGAPAQRRCDEVPGTAAFDHNRRAAEDGNSAGGVRVTKGRSNGQPPRRHRPLRRRRSRCPEDVFALRRETPLATTFGLVAARSSLHHGQVPPACRQDARLVEPPPPRRTGAKTRAAQDTDRREAELTK
mmetsp:Transcript_10681/g.37781  ORF Transcript_10681/g.37781 Transcript_10681/m.37781 type:complete len:353 (-) Transcript_10681:40-1098(-)